MVDEGVLNYEEESGKGGYHRVYFPKMDRKGFANYARVGQQQAERGILLAELLPTSSYT